MSEDRQINTGVNNCPVLELVALHRHLEEKAKYEGVFIYPDTPESEGWLGPK